MFSYVK